MLCLALKNAEIVNNIESEADKTRYITRYNIFFAKSLF